MTYVLSSSRPAARRAGFLNTLLRLDSLFRQRSHLQRLDAHLLNDIGVSAQAATCEAQRSLWDAPETWRS